MSSIIINLLCVVNCVRTLMWKACAHKSDDREDYTPRAEPQGPGSVYLSYPVAFNHAPEYPTCDYDNRIIAVQCRYYNAKLFCCISRCNQTAQNNNKLLLIFDIDIMFTCSLH
jgi:hypothetical protein